MEVYRTQGCYAQPFLREGWVSLRVWAAMSISSRACLLFFPTVENVWARHVLAQPFVIHAHE